MSTRHPTFSLLNTFTYSNRNLNWRLLISLSHQIAAVGAIGTARHCRQSSTTKTTTEVERLRRGATSCHRLRDCRADWLPSPTKRAGCRNSSSGRCSAAGDFDHLNIRCEPFRAGIHCRFKRSNQIEK